MRRILGPLTLLLIAGLLVVVATRGTSAPSATGSAPSAVVPSPSAPGAYPPPSAPTQPPYPGPGPLPTPDPTVLVSAWPSPAATPLFRPPTPSASPTPYRPVPTPTWGPLPTVLPTVVPANLPRPTGYPGNVPRRGLHVASESDEWSITKQVDSSDYVIRARVARIDPPFWLTTDGREPSVIDFQIVATPALLTVEQVYKGPPMQTLEAAVGGACFGPSRCTLFPSGYTWQDVVGYDLILFIAKGIQMPGQPARPASAFPARIFIVNPDSGKNEALSVQPSRSETWSLPDLLAQIRSAPTASH